MRYFLHILLCLMLPFVGCNSNSVTLTQACSLIKNGDNYTLEVVYHSEQIVQYPNVARLGWTEHDVLVKYRNEQGELVWRYVNDGGEGMVKSWGNYYDGEFETRSRELYINDLETQPISFWAEKLF